jgi:hypothetical protein
VRIRNRCSFPFEVDVPGRQGLGVPYSRSLPPMGTAVFPVAGRPAGAPDEITLKLTNVFVDRNTNLELTRPLASG